MLLLGLWSDPGVFEFADDGLLLRALCCHNCTVVLPHVLLHPLESHMPRLALIPARRAGGSRAFFSRPLPDVWAMYFVHTVYVGSGSSQGLHFTFKLNLTQAARVPVLREMAITPSGGHEF